MPPFSLPAKGPGSFEWWTSQLGWAADARTALKEKRRHLVNAYRDELVPPKPEAVRVNIEFEKTEQKRHQLFFQVPQLSLKPQPRTLRDLQTAGLNFRRITSIFTEVLQRLASHKGMNTKALMDMLLFDLLCPAGMAACKVGYERFENGTIPIQTGTEDVPMPGSILGLQTVKRPIFGSAPNIISERYYASRISPGHLLIPADFTGNDYARQADWLAYDFWITRMEAERRGWRIPPGLQGSMPDDDDRLVELDKKGQRDDQLKCREVWCYAQRIYQDIPHPEQIRRLIFVDGAHDPIVSQDSRDQVFDNRGRLVRGLRSLPIKVLTTRYISDYWAPPSDCAISRRYGEELSEGRTMMIVHRKRAVPLRQINISRIVDPAVRTQILRGEYLDIIPSETDNPIVQEVVAPRYPRENFSFNDQIMSDIERAWAMGANQQGISEQSTRTATEASLRQRATDNRLTGEKAAVVAFWLDIMETASQLVQLYANQEDYVEIVGEQGAKELVAWDKTTIPGEYLFDIVPDSADRPDGAAIRDRALNRYNLLANDPNINREQLVRRTLEELGDDPEGFVQPPQPPPEAPPKISISIRGEDLNPLMPQYPNIVALLEKGQIQLPVPPPSEPTGPAEVVDRERLRMAEADESDQRAGGLVGVPQ